MSPLETEEKVAENIANIYERRDTRKKESKTSDEYNENGLNINGLDRNGYNINGIKGNRIIYSNKKIKFKRDKNYNLYDQYGFDKGGFNKYGYDMHGFDKDRFNKDGFHKYGYKKKPSGEIKIKKIKSFKDQKGKGHANLPILLSKIYTNNSSKKLMNDIEQLVKNLYNNKQITKKVYNILIKAITYKNDS